MGRKQNYRSGTQQDKMLSSRSQGATTETHVELCWCSISRARSHSPMSLNGWMRPEEMETERWLLPWSGTNAILNHSTVCDNIDDKWRLQKLNNLLRNMGCSFLRQVLRVL